MTLALLVGACSAKKPGAAGPGGPRGPADVVVEVVATRPAEISETLPGRTAPFETSDVRPQVSGLIKDRPFTEGADVKAGAVLYEIDPAPFRATLNLAKAQLESARASVVASEAKAARYRDLVKINAVSRQEFDDSQSAALQARALVHQQEAAVEVATVNLGYTRVVAPISGRVGRSAVTRGALVTAGQAAALTTIQRLDPIYVDVTQPAADAVRLRQALVAGKVQGAGAATAAVQLQLEDGSIYPLTGKLQFSDVTVDPSTAAVTLRAIFANPRGILLPGLYVRAKVIEATDPTAILAPQQAVSRDEKGHATVLVVDAQGKAALRILTTAGTVGDRWRVTSGLAVGDRMIVEGLQAVKPGAPVHVVSERRG